MMDSIMAGQVVMLMVFPCHAMLYHAMSCYTDLHVTVNILTNIINTLSIVYYEHDRDYEL